MTNTDQYVAAEIRGLIAKNRGKQADLAEVLGMAQSSLSRRLSGLLPFTLGEAQQVADHYGVPLASLLPTAAAAS